MRWWLKIRKRWALDRDLRDELAFHQAMRAADREHSPPPFGNQTRIREEMRDMWSFLPMETAWRDVCFALRGLRRNPAFTAIAILTLALGIGANTAIFSVVNAVLLRPLPFRQPERVVLIEELIKKISAQGMPVTPTDLLEFQRHSQAFEGVAGYTFAAMDLTGGGQPERLNGLRVSPEIFPVLGVWPVLGRGFSQAEDRPGSGVAVISYRLWQRRFAGDPGVVGRVVELNRLPTTIIGVLPKDVEFPMPGLPFGGGHDVWVPLALTARELNFIGNYNFIAVARLKPGVTMDQALADVQATARRIFETLPAGVKALASLDAQVAPVPERVARDSRKLLWLLLGAVGLVLFIACVNVANLLLGRAAGREKELAIRSSLGASSARLLGQLLTESLLLSAAGGAAGLVVATWLLPLLVRVIPASVPRAAAIAIDWRVVAFTAAISILAGLLFGTMPALLAARTGPSARLKFVTRTATAGLARTRLRGLLVVTEVALSLVLLVGAGLLVRSLVALRSVDPGFDVQHVLTAEVALPATAYKDGVAARSFFDRAMAQFESLPGATAAGASTAPLLSLRNQQLFTVTDPSIPSALALNATVLGGYFQAVGIRLRRGRLFNDQDRRGSEPALVINETMARLYFPGKDAVGQQIKLGSPSSTDPWFTVIGVVTDVKNNELANEIRPQLYTIYSQIPDQAFVLGFGRSMVVAVKAASEPAALQSAVRLAVARLDPELPVSNLRTVRAQVDASLAPQSFRTGLVASFAGLALLLAAIGIYGVVSYAVAQRTQEIGVRMALGANTARVLELVIWQGMKPVLAGIALGVVASLALTHLISGFLYGVPPTDWITFSLAPVILSAVALTANLAPSWRAARVDPVTSLRYE